MYTAVLGIRQSVTFIAFRDIPRSPHNQPLPLAAAAIVLLFWACITIGASSGGRTNLKARRGANVPREAPEKISWSLFLFGS